MDYHHYMRLKMARQGKNESLQEFADRCRALAQKITCRVDDPITQRVHQENAKRMLLTSFVAGLGGEAGRQARFSEPRTLQDALWIALSVQEAERQEKFNNSFHTDFDRC
jgi:2-methylcitrate dehydratase PrpD